MIKGLCTLGNSDILVYGHDNQRYSRFKNFRSVTQKIWEVIEKGEFKKSGKDAIVLIEPIEVEIEVQGQEKKIVKIKKIRFPLLIAFLEKVEAIKKRMPNELILFATNQIPEHRSDTIYLAKIIQRVIPSNWKYRSIECVQIDKITAQPNKYSEMEKHFGEYFNQNGNFDFSDNFIQITAGTPAMGLNLALAVTELDLRHTFLYIEQVKDSEDSVAKKFTYFTKLKNMKSQAMLNKALNGFAYQTAIEILKDNASFRKEFEVEKLIEIMIKLRHFDFISAYDIAQELKETYEFVDFLGILNLPDKKAARFKVVFDLIEKYQQAKLYIEASVLLAGFHDNLRQFIFEQVTGVPVKVGKNDFSAFNQYIENDQGLLDKMSDVKYRNNPSKVVMSRIISYLDKSKKLAKEYHDLIALLGEIDNGINDVQSMRNDTIYAHGLSGITEDEYESKIRELVCKTKILLEHQLFNLRVYLSENVFECISKLVMQNIQKCIVDSNKPGEPTSDLS